MDFIDVAVASSITMPRQPVVGEDTDVPALEHGRRDEALFQFTTKQLRVFIDHNHLLIQINEQLDFAKLMAPQEERYCPDLGRKLVTLM